MLQADDAIELEDLAMLFRDWTRLFSSDITQHAEWRRASSSTADTDRARRRSMPET